MGGKRFIGLVSASLFVVGCASATPGQKGSLAGSAVGAGLGAVIGHQAGRRTAEGALLGAAAGGLGGALIGEASATKYCPTCGRSYFSDQTFCQFDGTPLKTKGAPAQPARVQPSQPFITNEIVVINVPNKNGSFTPVRLQAVSDGTYIGPRGEVYTSRPTVDQLKDMYGK